MLKKVVLWTVYAGVMGLLVLGAVIRTSAKVEGENLLPAARQSGEGIGQSTGNGSNSLASLAGDGLSRAESEDQERAELTGVVSGLDAESLWIVAENESALEITGRAWRFIQESGFALAVGNRVELEGFLENGRYEVSEIRDLTSGASLLIRDQAGRPLWNGGSGH